MSKPDLFIELAAHRSGSTWMEDFLSSHPDIYGGNEHLLRLREEFRKIPGDAGGTEMLKPAFACGICEKRSGVRPAKEHCGKGVLEEFFQSSGCQAAKVCILKVMHDQLFRLGLDTYLAERGDVSVLHITRENKVDHALSRLTAFHIKEVRGHGDAYEGVDAAHCELGKECPSPKFVVDVEQAIANMKERQDEDDAVTSWMRESGVRHRSVFYEDLSEGCMSPMLNFLGVDPEVELSGVYVKRRTGGQRDTVENWEEFASRVAETPFRWHLDGYMPGKPAPWRRQLQQAPLERTVDPLEGGRSPPTLFAVVGLVLALGGLLWVLRRHCLARKSPRSAAALPRSICEGNDR